MKILIVRHADPDYVNNTLTEKGFKEAKLFKEYYKDLKIDAIYSSPLPRAYLTASIFNEYHHKHIEVIEEFQEFLHEVDVPYLEKKNTSWDFLPSYLFNEKDLLDNNKYLDHEIFKKSEIKKYYDVVIQKFDEILYKHGYKRNKLGYFDVINSNKDTIIIFCHLGLMSLLLSSLLNVPFTNLAQFMCCLPSGVTTLVTEEREEGIAQFRMLEYGELSHLKFYNEEPSFAARFCENFKDNTRH